MTNEERFIDIYQTNIKREGADKLLDYLRSPQSDFFTAPASTRFHSNYAGGLLDHSLNVYDCLVSYIDSGRFRDMLPDVHYTEESMAIVALLHDLCKVNVYKKGFRNVKDERGIWQKVESFDFDDTMPYGHGEKSVYIISGYMKLTREEAFAIRYHMGYSTQYDDPRNIGWSFEHYPLAFALSVADSEATYFLESKEN